MNAIETLAFNLNEKIITEIQQTIEHRTLILYEFSLEYSKYQAILFPIPNFNIIYNYNIPNMQPQINLININANKIPQNPIECNKQKDFKLLNKKRFKTDTKSQIETSKQQAIKNKKVVYCHSDTILNNTLKKEKNKQLNINVIANTNTKKSNPSDDSFTTNPYLRKSRGSIYRGVSRNGNQWQVLIMINKKKSYIGSYSTEEKAAKEYDVVALCNHGKKAKTNFYYTPEEIEKII